MLPSKKNLLFELEEPKDGATEEPKKEVKKRKPKVAELPPNTPEGITEECVKCLAYPCCNSPFMNPYGKNELGVVLVGDCPSAEDDRRGRPFMGNDGEELSLILRSMGLDVGRDFLRLNVMQCFPANGEFKKVSANKCKHRWHKQILDSKPQLIIMLGGDAWKLVGDPPLPLSGHPPNITSVRGRVFPLRQYGCWGLATLHPREIFKSLDNKRDPNLHKEITDLVTKDLWRGFEHLGKPLPELPNPKDYMVMRTVEEVLNLEKALFDDDRPVSVDYETNQADPYGPNPPQILFLSVAIMGAEHFSFIIPLDHKEHTWLPEERLEVVRIITRIMSKEKKKIVQNVSFEMMWTEIYFGVPFENYIYDTMLGAHVIDSRKGTTSLAFQVFELNGDKYKEKVDRLNLADTSLEVAAEYGGLDARYPLMLTQAHEQKMEAEPFIKEGYKLCHDSIRTLTEMEMTGIRADREALQELKEDCAKEIQAIEEWVYGSEPFQKYISLTGKTPNFAHVCVNKVLFDIMNLPKSKRTTRAGNPEVGQDALAEMANEMKPDTFEWELVKKIARGSRLTKLMSNFIQRFEASIHPDGRFHPGFLMHVVETYRSSSTNPSFHNLPKHDPYTLKFRKVIAADPGYLLVSGDFSAAEVRCLAMRSKDPTLVKYMKTGYDMHKEWAAKGLKLPLDQIKKELRQIFKNKLVFPWYYGATVGTVLRGLRDGAVELSDISGMATEIQRLRTITYEEVLQMEKLFWREFAGVHKWQKKVWTEYKATGYAELASGFRRRGPLEYNELISTVIQGPTFHIVLKGLCETRNRLVDEKLKAKPVIEVHDDGLFLVPEDEVSKFLSIADEEFTKKRYDWQGDVPMNVKWGKGKNWYEMEDIELS